MTKLQTTSLMLLAIASMLVAPYVSWGSSPTVEWLHQIRSPRKAYEVATGISTDRLGNVFVTGWADDQLGDDHFGSSDAFVSKYDSDGALIWTEQLGTDSSDHSYAIVADGFGKVYIGGRTTGALGGTHLGGGTDAFLSMYDVDGSLLWTKQFGTDRPDSIRSLTIDQFGNAYVTGATLGSIDGTTQPASDIDSSAFASKFLPSGEHVWTKQFGTNEAERGFGITADQSGHVYLSGQTTGSLGGDSAGRFDTFLMKLDTGGDEIWTRQFGTRDHDYNTGVASDGAGNVYVTGHTEGDLGSQNAGDDDAYLAKYDEDGELLWTRLFGTSEDDQSWGVATDSYGNAYVTGYTQGDLGASNAGSGDVFVSKFDPAGSLLWTEQFGTDEFDGADGVAVDPVGNVYLAGHTEDIFEPRFPDLFQESFLDAFVVKFANPVPEPSTLVLAIFILLGRYPKTDARSSGRWC